MFAQKAEQYRDLSRVPTSGADGMSSLKYFSRTSTKQLAPDSLPAHLTH